ncbi:lmo0937 family membrane protein [Sphingobacterium sp.]|uniref:lmo0937 family membrane protein n=1 Tax=Sphingobacterium sp. TaxID=341027 RepID=UPI0028A5EF8E|nr:lmo0937 family membrane protein [Sphingobacterium sp.]
MEDLLYSVAVSIVIIWAVTFLGGFITEDFIHILLAFATIALIFRAIKTVYSSRLQQSKR